MDSHLVNLIKTCRKILKDIKTGLETMYSTLPVWRYFAAVSERKFEK